MSWLTGPREPPRKHPAVRGINDTEAGRSAVLSEASDTKHSWQHMLRYQVVEKQHVRLHTATVTADERACTERPEVETTGRGPGCAVRNDVGRSGSFP